MDNKVKIIAAVVIVALMVGAVAWYVQQNTSQSGPTTSVTESTSQPLVTLTFWTLYDQLRVNTFQEIFNNFTAQNPGIQVNLVSYPQTLESTKIIQAVTSGTVPDVFFMPDYLVGTLYGMGALSDLTQRITVFNDFNHIALEPATRDGKIVGVPFTMYNDGVYYRIDRFKELGLPLPNGNWTTDDFLRDALALTRVVNGTQQYGFGMRGSGAGSVEYATTFMYAFGGDVVNSSGQVVVNSTQAVQGLQWYVDLCTKYKVCPPSAPSDGWAQMSADFGRGVTSMYIHNCAGVQDQNGYNPGNGTATNPTWGTAPIPIGPTGKRVSYMGEYLLGLMSGSTHQDAAWKLIQFMASDWAMSLWNQKIVQVPPRESVAALPVFSADLHMAAFAYSSSFLGLVPYNISPYPSWGGIAGTTGVTLFDEALAGQITAQQMANQFAAALIEGESTSTTTTQT
ncbi:MAG: sugar ABC transporter substrate-binding protein [Candidatus Bathyarchaeia archaeon]|jgi:multiple sugar transport system substrate-binding protein